MPGLPNVAPLRAACPDRQRVRRPMALLLVALAGMGVTAIAGTAAPLPAPAVPGETAQAPRFAADGSLIVPAAPVDGVLGITIPAGTTELMAQGGHGYILPSVIDLTKGDKIVIRNEDSFPHLMLWAFLLPGQSDERTFSDLGSEVYSAGCTVDPTPNGFVSLVVHDAESL